MVLSSFTGTSMFNGIFLLCSSIFRRRSGLDGVVVYLIWSRACHAGREFGVDSVFGRIFL